MLIAAIIFLILAVIGLMAVLIWKCSGDKEATSIRQKEGKDRKEIERYMKQLDKVEG